MPLHSATALLAAAFLLLSVSVRAQTAAATPEQLAKYDKNHNGKLDPDELAAMQADEARAQGSAVQSAAPVQLNPFVVDESKEKGYFAASTLAGTRLNTNIADLPSAITVVTKQQMEDTNSLNLNDVFRYESNTEGARTYTPFTLVRGNMVDVEGGGGVTSGTFTNAADSGNRVRGLAAVDQNEDNFFSLYRIPFDAYNTQSVEIDRGPNSLIFGTGSPAGIVNQTRTQATLDKFSAEVQLQASSWGGYRESVGINIPLKKDVFGIYVGEMYGSQGFEQKPSYDLTRRQYLAFDFQPFKSHKTKITGSVENYNNTASDPNSITPIDAVSPWVASGEPVYNQLTEMVNYLGTGKTSGPYAFSTTAPNYVAGGPTQALLTTSTSPYFVPSMTFFANHVIEFISQGHIENTYKGQQTAGSVPGAAFSPAYNTLTAAQQLIYGERPAESTTLPVPALANGTAKYTVWYLPSVVSKSVYDWSSINLNSLDTNYTRAKTYTLDLQQELLPGLNLDLAWFRQELKQTEDDPTSQASAPELFVDLNTILPNGAPNPHVGQPFEDTYQSDVYVTPEINNNYRALLEYGVDLREKVPSWLKWLGHHRFVGSYSQHDDVFTNLRYRPSLIGGDPNYLPTTTALAAVAGYSYPASSNGPEEVHYLGGAITQGAGFGASSPGHLNGPGYGGPTSATITTYNYVDNQWENSTVNYNSVLFATGGIQENLQDQKAYYWQSYFWNDRLVGTLGIDDDQVKNRSNIFPATNPSSLEYTGITPNTPYWYHEGPWAYSGGNTSTMGFVAHPFKNWARIDGAAEEGNYFAGFLRALGVTFNKAGNFNPPSSLQTDFFGHQIGKPQGNEKDYGLELATPDNKFFVKATWFTNSNENVVTTFTSVGRGNYLDATLLKDWATTVVEIRSGQNPTTDANFGNVSIYPITVDMQNQISALMGLPYNYGGNVGEFGQYVNPTGTESGIAKGVDLELNYNPLPNWTMKFTWGRQNTVISGAAQQAADWFTYRMPKWVAYAANDLPTVYTKTNGTAMYVGNFWQGYGYDANTAATNTAANNAAGLTTSQSYFNSIVESVLVVDQANNGGAAPNQREYSWNYLTNYRFIEGPLKDFGVTGALNFSGRATAGYYGNTSLLNPAGQVAIPNLGAPIYQPARFHLDLGVSYQFKLAHNILAKVQLNVADLTSNGYLLPISYNFDGSPAAERIIPPRQFSLTTKFNY